MSVLESYNAFGIINDREDITINEDFRQNVINADTYITDGYFTGTYSFSYTYHMRRWFQVGGTATFAAVTKSCRSSITNKKIESLNEYVVSVMPTCRFIYFYRDKVQLYSSTSLGVVLGNGFVTPWVDLTLFGCSFGRKVFGFAELGCGVGGFGRVGIGYRFDAKKK